jgi:hypothetical protein
MQAGCDQGGDAMSNEKPAPLGYCCYGGLKTKAECGSCAAWNTYADASRAVTHEKPPTLAEALEEWDRCKKWEGNERIRVTPEVLTKRGKAIEALILAVRMEVSKKAPDVEGVRADISRDMLEQLEKRVGALEKGFLAWDPAAGTRIPWDAREPNRCNRCGTFNMPNVECQHCAGKSVKVRREVRGADGKLKLPKANRTVVFHVEGDPHTHMGPEAGIDRIGWHIGYHSGLRWYSMGTEHTQADSAVDEWRDIL